MNNVRVLQEAPRKTLAIILPVDVYATHLEALVDTGAVRNFINPSAISKEQHATVEADNKKVALANGTEVEIKWKVKIEFEIYPDKKTRYIETFYLLEDCHPSLLLGMEFLSANDVTIDMKNNLISLNNRFYMISEGCYKELESIDHDLAESSRICVVAETPSEKGLRLMEE